MVEYCVPHSIKLYTCKKKNTSFTHIFFKPGSLVGSTLHRLLPLPDVSFQILNLESALWKSGVDLLVKGLGHAKDDAI